MAKHEFGIMERAPRTGERYDEYEPELYGCISVDDELIEKMAWDVQNVHCFWHTVDRAGKGLAYTGVTLIPPESLGEIIEVLGEKNEFSALRCLLEKAMREEKFVIHFGL